MALPDALWKALVAGLAAYVASSAKRWPLLVGAAIVAVTAQSLAGVVLALLAVLVGALSTLKVHRRAVFARGACGGLSTISVMVSGSDRPGWHTGIVALVLLASVGPSGIRHMSPRERKAVLNGLGALSALVVLASGAAGAAAAQKLRTIDRAVDELQAGLALARSGDIEPAAGHFQRASDLASSAERSISRLGWPARLVPGVSQHVDVLVDALDGSAKVADQAAITVGIVTDGALRTRLGQVDIQAVEDLRLPFRRLTRLLGDLSSDLDSHAADPLLPVLERKVERLSEITVRATREAERAARAAEVMPSVLGVEAPRRYLVIFTSPAEARGRFGFPGSFAEVIIERGRMRIGEQGTTSAEFNPEVFDQSEFDLTDEALAPYVGFGPTTSLLSSTIPPDFPTVAKVVAEQWRQSGRAPLDGVLRFDPRSLAPLLDWTGPVELPDVPEPLTSANLERYLVFDQYVQFPTAQAPRREVLETVADVTFDRLVATDLPAPRTLAAVFGPLAEEGHIDVAAFDPAAAAFLAEIGLDGRFADPRADGLIVTTVNSVGNKIDTFLSKDIQYRADVVDEDLTGTVAVTVRNDAPPSGLPFYVIGSSTRPPLPTGTNRSTVLVYTMARPRAITVDGRSVASAVVIAGGRWLAQVPVDVPPQGEVTVRLELDGPVDRPDGRYFLELEPGGAATPDRYDVKVRVDDQDELRHTGRVQRPLMVR